MWSSPLVKKNKKRARAILYTSGAILLALLAVARSCERRAERAAAEVEFDLSWRIPVEEYEAMPEVALLQEYLRIDTSPSGTEVDGAAFFAAKLAEVGIESTIERIGERNANLWAVIEGEDSRAVVLHNHIDVDAISHPDAWRFGPFDAHIDVPWIFGRGAFDMKSVAIAQLEAFRALAQSGVRPARSVIFLATGDEETGSHYGLRWFLREHPDLVARFETVITEGGVVETVKRDSVKYWGLEFAQKRFLRISACHARRERLEAMAEDLRGLESNGFRRFVTPQVETMMESYGPTRQNPRFRQIVENSATFAHDMRLGQIPEYLQLMVRGDVVVQAIEEDPAGSGYRLSLFIAMAPTDRTEDALAELLPEWIIHGVAIGFETIEPRAGESPLDHPDVERILEFMRQDVPSAPHGPMLIPFALTDARHFRALGIPAYGYSPFIIFSTDTQQMKGPNERLALPAFVDGTRRYRDLVQSLVAR